MSEYQLRQATGDDVTVIAAIQARYDVAWIGAAQRSEAEVAEELGLASETVVVTGEQGVVAAASSAGPHTLLAMDPSYAPQPILAALAGWLGGHPGSIEVFSGDERLQLALTSIGFAHTRSAFELTQTVDQDWQLDSPSWPPGLHITDMRAATPQQVYDLIYLHSGWAEVEGHVDRDLASWKATFVTDRDPPEQQVLVWRDDQLVAAALGRIFDDGGGWVAQLAVAKTERRTGIGRALLLEALSRRVSAGATSVGLGVQAENAGALALYLGVGLEIVREWQVFARRE